MPRIRTIKPEFWGDEKLAPLSPIDRLVFLGLISLADDAGRVVDNVKSLDGFVFPETEDSVRDSLETLARAGRILRYESESGQRLLQVANWLKHQKVDKPSKHVLPAPPARTSRRSVESVAEPSRESRAPILDLGPSTLDRGPGTDDLGAAASPCAHARESESDRNGAAATADDERPPVIVLTAAANRGITERFGEQPNPLRYHAPSSTQATERIQNAGVPIAFARDAIYTRTVDLPLERPPRSLLFYADHVVERWQAEQAHAVAASSDARRLPSTNGTGNSTSGNGDTFDADLAAWGERKAAELAAKSANQGANHG